MKLPTIRGWRQLCDVVEDFGFLPFQECGVDGFSVFGLTNPERWEWSGPGNPWWWRLHLPNTGRLVLSAFRRRRSKRGEAYGWPVAYSRTPAAALGPVDRLPRESPEKSLAAMVARVREAFPDAPVRDIETLLTKV